MVKRVESRVISTTIYGQPPSSFEDDNMPDKPCGDEPAESVPTVPSKSETRNSSPGPYRNSTAIGIGLLVDFLA